MRGRFSRTHNPCHPGDVVDWKRVDFMWNAGASNPAAFFHERGGDAFTVVELSQQWQKNRERRPADLAAGLGNGVQ